MPAAFPFRPILIVRMIRPEALLYHWQIVEPSPKYVVVCRYPFISMRSPYPYPPLKMNETGVFVYQDPANVGINVNICATTSDPTNIPGDGEDPVIVKRGGNEIAIPICYENKNTVEMTWRVRAEGELKPFLDEGIIVRLDKESFLTPAVSSVLDDYLASKAVSGNFTAYIRAGDTASLGRHIITIMTDRKDAHIQGYTGVGRYIHIDVRN